MVQCRTGFSVELRLHYFPHFIVDALQHWEKESWGRPANTSLFKSMQPLPRFSYVRLKVIQPTEEGKRVQVGLLCAPVYFPSSSMSSFPKVKHMWTEKGQILLKKPVNFHNVHWQSKARKTENKRLMLKACQRDFQMHGFIGQANRTSYRINQSNENRKEHAETHTWVLRKNTYKI